MKKYNKVNKAYWAAREGKTVAGLQQPIVEAGPLIEELKSYYNEEELKGIIGLKKDAPPVEPAYEEPRQTYVILNEKRGFIFCSPIFAG